MDDTIGVQYRKPTEADADAIADAINRSKREITLYQDINSDEVYKLIFKNENHSESGYWLAEIDNSIVGYSDCLISNSRIAAGKNDGHVNIEAIPEVRDNVIERQLMALSLEHLKSKNIKTANYLVEGTDGWKHNVASEFGFKDVRHGYTMLWNNVVEPDVHDLPNEIEFEKFMFKEMSKSDIKRAVRILNETFSGQFNYSPATVEDLIKSRDEDDGGTRITFAKSGKKVIGTCTSINRDETNSKNTGTGLLMGLGVSKSHQKMGIGKALLSNGMKWLWDSGIRTICLGVDVKNDNAADIYKSLGFNIESEAVFYQKTI